jgi:ABC-type Fe3+-hydroxamate transport system, periplasmic component
MEPVKFKTILTVIIVSAGGILGVFLIGGGNVTANQSLGIGIDFGERNVVWTDMDLHVYGDPKDALERACSPQENNFVLKIEDGTVIEINGVVANETRTWDLWVVQRGSTSWEKLSGLSVNLLNFTVSMWAYCNDTEKPTVAVDQVGNSIYGFPQAQRTVTLSPSLTEMIGSLNAVNTLVGTDKYSNYPAEVINRQKSGDITIVGDFLSPSYELIMKVSPDIVFCDGSQYSHFEMSERLKKIGVNSLVMYGGESIDTIMDNIFIMGVAMGYDLRSLEVIDLIEEAIDVLTSNLKSEGTEFISTMVALSSDKAPWVSGSYTYIDDILTQVFGENVFSSNEGWIHSNSEYIAKNNPSTIIILTEDYLATQVEYELMLSSMSKEWKNTEAYKKGRIYMICGDANEMISRAGPRCAQIMELVARILHTGAFDGAEIPQFIGNDYEKHLTFTKDLGFG